MSDLTDNLFYPSAKRIWLCIRLNNGEKWACDRFIENADFGKKNCLFRWSSFWSWRLCKQAILSPLGHKNPARIHWKADLLKKSHWLDEFWSRGIIGPFFFEKEQGEAVKVNGDRYRTMLNEFLFTKIEEQHIGKIWFQQDGATCHTAKATLDVLRPVFEDRIISHRADVVSPARSCVRHRWTIICGVLSKISFTIASQRQMTL